ncbi:hypothetical protein MFUM_700027 [Methylacidiphilum fumariolicum SolV]|uniref:Uncharacterized protein n=2 Tax=Candidatus Methylacidiphilum fumarolicum TaxID=591154 RepID=I0JZ09_METFB|nr:conserved protein of unknown function [Candidatus Methylacidiphilum fumarolicum]CCG92478.1 hypothetical protein MFUM_700027 [Methylacidiphilum fumariolicum SolV]
MDEAERQLRLSHLLATSISFSVGIMDEAERQLRHLLFL